MKLLLALIVLALVTSAVALPGCGGGSKTYTEQDTSINAKVGSQLVIELQSNRTTGYQWGLSGTPDPAVVKKISSKYVQPENAQQRLGAGGVEDWTFEAVGKGSTKIDMVYTRSFEQQATPAQSFTFDVKVE
jgi:inhibitor of cysteine peptidase